MENGWQRSADAWVAEMGERGDFGRRYVLDPLMLPRALASSPQKALDVGCGEGRFCRMLKSHGVDVVGIDPTPALIAVAQRRDAGGTYLKARAESLPFRREAFDLVVSYLSLIDIPDAEAAFVRDGSRAAAWRDPADRQSHQLEPRGRAHWVVRAATRTPGPLPG